MPQGPEYLIVNFPILFVWGLLYYLYPRGRTQMLNVSIIVGILSVMSGLTIWTHDWWHPPTITGTVVGIEDFLLGFGFAGISTVLYEFIADTRLKQIKKDKMDHWKKLALTLIVGWGLFKVSLIIGYPSWIGWAIGSTAALLTIFYFRPDLIENALITGALMTLIALLWFGVLTILDTSFTAQWYIMENLTGITVLGGPIEDYIWAITAGALAAVIYEFTEEYRTVREME